MSQEADVRVRAGARKAMTRVTRRVEKERRSKMIKRGIFLGFVMLLLILAALALSPVGPAWYYSFLQNRKMSSRSALRPGYLGGLYGLGVFYAYTGRVEQAAECMDEIGLLYLGVRLKEIVRDPDAAREKRNDLITAIGSGTASGPPFSIPAEDVQYVGKAVMQMAEMYLVEKNRQYAYRLYREAYADVLLKEDPNACDPADVKQVNDYFSAYTGRR